jgi:hypothetical protein
MEPVCAFHSANRRKFLVLKHRGSRVKARILESRLHQSVLSPAGGSSFANAWDVFRFENLALEGFSNAVFR